MKKLAFLLFIPLLFTACDEKGDLEVAFRMLYDGAPITMFERVDYPSGGTIFFDRVNVFISDISAEQNDGKLQDAANVHFLDFSNIQDMTQANEGIKALVPDLPAKKYNKLLLGIGLDSDWNSTSPSDYDTNHPLSNNYWEEWNGYIFVVLEGKADMDNDGQTDFSFSYHIGKDEAYNMWTASTDFDIEEDKATTVVVNFDLKKVLSNSQQTLDMEQNQIDHSGNPEVYNFLTSNFVDAFSIE